MVSEVITRTDVVHAWFAFERGKRHRADVAEFAFDLEGNLEQLYHDLITQTYRHGPYRIFVRHDPKRRTIAVPAVRDQIVHHLLVRVIGPIFERVFHPHSYASRSGKGVHVAIKTVHDWVHACSDGGRRRCWVLRMDVASFFASVDHATLRAMLCLRVSEPWMSLCDRVIESFGEVQNGRRCGLPLGNVTSQLFANAYLHELDWFAAHTLRVRRYARYMDDVVVVHQDAEVLLRTAAQCQVFASDALHLEIPPRKVTLVPAHRGVDWLGAAMFPCHRVLRPVTLHRMRDRIRERVFAYLDDGLPYHRLRATFAAYDGLLQSASHDLERDRLLALNRAC